MNCQKFEGLIFFFVQQFFIHFIILRMGFLLNLANFNTFIQSRNEYFWIFSLEVIKCNCAESHSLDSNIHKIMYNFVWTVTLTFYSNLQLVWPNL